MSKNSKPALLIMAAGMGSRYGGPKQIDPIGPNGEILIDYSLFDAKQAGFEKLVFVINKSIESDFMEVIGERIEKRFQQVNYVFQSLDALPEGYISPTERKKPWGTGHAVLCCKEYIDGPFAVINADDYYGRRAYNLLYEQLSGMYGKGEWCMAGYELKNTLTEHGYVARGICEVDKEGMLQSITERVRVEKRDAGAAYTEDGGESYVPLPLHAVASMNLWGFTEDVFDTLEGRFPQFLDTALKNNPAGAEFFLPNVVGDAIKCGEANVRVLPSPDKWYGVTYREDKSVVAAAIREMINNGLYPQSL